MIEIYCADTHIEMAEIEKAKTDLPLMIKGKSMHCGYIVNKNFYIPESELDNVINTLKAGIDGTGAYILKDHGTNSMFGHQSVDYLVGKITNASKDGKNVIYEGRIEDADLAYKIRKGLVSSSSIGLSATKLYCSICGREYGHIDCSHRLGQEYNEEGFAEEFKAYLEDFGNKAIATIVGKGLIAKEQSIVLFPAIPGSNAKLMGMDFSVEADDLIKSIEAKKNNTVAEDKNMAKTEEIKTETNEIVEGFNKEKASVINEQSMSEKNTELESLKADFVAFTSAFNVSKLEAEGKVNDLKAQLETAKTVIQKFQDSETQRLVAERTAKISELVSLRKEKGIAEKDYSKASDEVLMGDLNTLRALKIASVTQGKAATADPVVENAERKEDIREIIFGIRKDGKALKGVKNL